MDYFALVLPILLIIALFAGLVVLKRRMFTEEPTPAPIPIPDIHATGRRGVDAAPASSAGPAAGAATAAREAPRTVDAAPPAGSGDEQGVSLTPARLYPARLLEPGHKAIFSRLLKALPGYVVLPRISYDQFLKAQDGTPSENTSLQNRAAQQLADFVICDRKLNVLLVCQVEDGTLLPARIEEREKMLHKAGLRLLRWNVDSPPDPAKLLNTVQTLEKLSVRAVG